MAAAKLQGTIFSPEDPVRLATFIDVVDQRPSYSPIALNAPIGRLNQANVGGRSCDREARLLLGRRGASVKSAPVQVSAGPESTCSRITSTPSARRSSPATRRWPPRWRRSVSGRSTR